ncbi:MAG: HEAT repeat domain-containing protein [Janthinobacterium lividum]
MSHIIAFLRSNLRAIVIVVVLVLAVYFFVNYNHAHQKALEGTLADGTPAVRDAAVQELVENGKLVDVLINTENPDEDVASPQNTSSLMMRMNATDSVNRLSAEQKITPDEAFDTLFLICKDTGTGIKANAETGLTALGNKNDANLNAVVQRLSNGDPDIRGAAVDVLGQIGGDKSAAAVNAVLSNTASQDSAISALQKIGAPSVPLIVAHLEDPAMQNDIAFRQQMVGVLDQITSPSSVPELIKLAGMPIQPSVQRLAQVALADTVLAAYTSMQTDKATLASAKDAAARAAAMTALTKDNAGVPAVQSAEPALRAILSDTNADSESRSQAALALGQYASPTAIAALVTGLGDFDAQVRDASETGIQSSGSPAVGPLVVVLSHGQALPRIGAAQALGGIGTPAAVSALTTAFHGAGTPDAVREGAMVGLGRSGNPTVIPTLVQALGDHDGIVAGAAQTGLLTPALAKPAIPLLVAALSQPTPVPFNASETLSRMGALAESNVVPLLTKAIQAGNAPTQTWAAVTMGEIGTKSAPALTALQGLSKSTDPHVQYAASQSLLRLAGA